MKKGLIGLMFFVLVASMLLSACAASPVTSAEQTVAGSKFSQEFKLAYISAANVYAQHVKLDAEETELVRRYTSKMQNLRDEVGDELAIMNLCYKNTEEFFIAALTNAFGQNGMNGQENSALMNMLALNQTYPGDISTCQKAATDTIVYMRAHREESVNIRGEIYRVKNQVVQLEMGDLKTAVIIEFYQKYGADLQALIQSGDKEFAKFVGSRTKDQILPASFIGFPTEALQAESRDTKVCLGYLDIQNGKVAAPFGKYAYQYQVSYDPVSKICVLYKAAAEGYITMITTPSLATAEDLQEGCTSTIPGGCDSNK